MKKTSALILIVLALAMPLIPAGAQEDETAVQTETRETAESGQPEARRPASQGTKAPQINIKGAVTPWINRIIGYISQIGNLFGSRLGFRVGGTTGTAIAALLLAKFLEDKAPSWVRYLLYAGGGTMFAGSGANITQLIMRYLQQ